MNPDDPPDTRDHAVHTMDAQCDRLTKVIGQMSTITTGNRQFITLCVHLSQIDTLIAYRSRPMRRDKISDVGKKHFQTETGRYTYSVAR